MLLSKRSWHTASLFLLLFCLPILAIADTAFSSMTHTRLNGKPARIDDLRGTVVLVNFWGTWCGPCRKEMPLLNQVYQQWKPRGVIVLGIALDPKSSVDAYLRKVPISYPVWIANDNTISIFPAIGNTGMVVPFAVLLDRKGRVVQHWTGTVSHPQLNKALSALAP